MSRRYAVLTLLLVALVVAGVLPGAAEADLLRVGPLNPAVGYPAWYQDRTGLALELCVPNAAELADGWCLLLPADVPDPNNPDSFPGNFADEHFYWAADASADFAFNGQNVRALLVLALEAAFAVDQVIPGDQLVFGRVRIRIDPLPYTGTYTVYTPYGKFVFAGQIAGERLFFTDDIGISCAQGDFTCALSSKVGPFLLPSNTPGGAELPPVEPGTGKKYIADPGTVYKVTGSPLPPFQSAVGGTHNHNVFRIEVLPDGASTPLLLSETTDFALMGRIYTGTIPGRVTVDRATYARSSTGNRLDVFATGLPTTSGRLPAGAQPPATPPQLQYYDAPCVANLDENGVLTSYSAPPSPPAPAATQMLGAGTSYWGQSSPAPIPAEICVLHLNATAGFQTASAVFPAVVGDQVFISEAVYDPQNQRLSVAASSSDLATPPTLTAQGLGTLTGGSLVVQNLIAPPGKVRVTSSAGGASELQVTTGVGGTGPGQSVPLAVNDAPVAVLEDSGPATIQVLSNDTIGGQPIPAGSVVTLASLPRLGTASANADGTIRYTPNGNANGSDSFTYTVAVNGVVSNAANVAITITPQNDSPVAFNDSYNAFVNVAAQLAVLANDTDVDGVADLVAIDNLTVPTTSSGATATATAAGKLVDFLATTPGTYTFTYRAKDTAGATSANATVTVNVAAGETITIARAEFRASGGRLRIEGTINPVTNPPQRLEVRWADGSNTVSIVATPVANATGLWAVDLKGVTGIQDPRKSGATKVVVTSPAGGSSPVTPLATR